MHFYSVGSSQPGYSGYNFYPQNQTFDLREQIHAMLFGDASDPGIGQKILLRRLRDTLCACWDGVSGSPTPTCAYCDGEGFLWEEDIQTGYLARNTGSTLGPSNVIANQQNTAKWGIGDENRAVCYFEAQVFPNYERYLRPDHPSFDKLYELKVDLSGRMVTPLVRTAKWSMKSVTPHRGDNGAVSHFEVGLEKISV